MSLHLPSIGLLKLGRGGSHVLLGEADKLCEPCGVFDRHVRENLTIEGDIGLLEGIDESAIGHPLCPNGGADTSNP